MKEFTAEKITQDLVRTGVCNIPGVVKITVVDKPSRQGRNPSTGEPITIKAHKTLKFSASSVLKQRVNNT